MTARVARPFDVERHNRAFVGWLALGLKRWKRTFIGRHECVIQRKGHCKRCSKSRAGSDRQRKPLAYPRKSTTERVSVLQRWHLWRSPPPSPEGQTGQLCFKANSIPSRLEGPVEYSNKAISAVHRPNALWFTRYCVRLSRSSHRALRRSCEQSRCRRRREPRSRCPRPRGDRCRSGCSAQLRPTQHRTSDWRRRA